MTILGTLDLIILVAILCGAILGFMIGYRLAHKKSKNDIT